MKSHIVVLALLLSIVAFASPMYAGPLPPCMKASASRNGRFLVIASPEVSSQGSVQRLLLEVFPRERFVGDRDKLHSPNAFWTDWPQWSVVLDPANRGASNSACPITLITDDAEFLVIVNTGVLPEQPALRIFRWFDRPRRHGPTLPDRLPKSDVLLKELWPKDKLVEGQIITDETPQWYAGGRMEFSADSRWLICETRWGNTVRINLVDGSVSPMQP